MNTTLRHDTAHAPRAADPAAFAAALTRGMPDLRDGTCHPNQGWDPDIWSRPQDGWLALSLCRRCPVLERCREWTDATVPTPHDVVQGGRMWELNGRAAA